MHKFGRRKIYPEEVEEALKKNDDVFDCLVVGMPDEKFGQKIVAVVSTVDNKQLDQLQLIEDTRKVIAGYKLPKAIIFIDHKEERAPIRRNPSEKQCSIARHSSTPLFRGRLTR